MRTKVLLPLLFLILSTVARAQDVQPAAQDSAASNATAPKAAQVEGSEPARLAIYFDRISHSRSIALAPGDQAQFSVVALGSAGGIKAWEAKVVLSDGIVVLKREADGLNVGATADEWRVGLGKVCKQEQEIVLATYTVTVAPNAGNDLVLGLAPVENGSFHPPVPGYLACEGLHDLRSFAYPDTAAVINPEKIQLAPAGASRKAKFEMGKAGG
jgi:hypothetical protein